MGRNPVVGRQGPAYHAATIPDEGTAKRVHVKQIRSAIGHSETMRRTARPSAPGAGSPPSPRTPRSSGSISWSTGSFTPHPRKN